MSTDWSGASSERGRPAGSRPDGVEHDGSGLSDLEGTVDFAGLFDVLHEASDRPGLIEALRRSLRPGGRLYFSEPRFHVRIADADGAETSESWNDQFLASGVVRVCRK